MKQQEVQEWLSTAPGGLKRKHDDHPANIPLQDTCRIRRRKFSQASQKSLLEARKLKRSKSEGDIDCGCGQSGWTNRTLLPTPHQQENGDFTADMANAPPSPRGSDSFTMPPPSRPTSRASSKMISQNTRPPSTTTSHSDYRNHILRPNHIFIQHTSIPEDVSAVVNGILSDREDVSALDDKEARVVVDFALANESGNEADVIKGLDSVIFTTESLVIHSRIRVDRTVFTTKAIPYFPMSEIFGSKQPAVSNPMPDMLYGYPFEAFNSEQEEAQKAIDHQCGCILSATSRNLLWGFLIVEFKSQATGGSIWSATNQCAGGGSTCTNALYRMFTATKRRDDNIRSDSICFSIATDGQTASLYVHWYDVTTRVRGLKRDVDNIIEWGVNTRLPTIRSALDLFITRAQREWAATSADS